MIAIISMLVNRVESGIVKFDRVLSWATPCQKGIAGMFLEAHKYDLMLEVIKNIREGIKGAEVSQKTDAQTTLALLKGLESD